MSIKSVQQIGPEKAMETVARWFSGEGKLRINWTKGTDVCADIKNKVLHIPIACCANGLSPEALSLLRAKIYHEAAHILETDETDFKGAKFKILNALEDVRIEAKTSFKGEGIAYSYRFQNEKINNEWSERASAGKVTPFMEAIAYLMFVNDNIAPNWTLSEKAKELVDLADPIFAKVHDAKSSKDCEKLAEKIFNAWKDKIEEQKEEEQKKKEQKEKGEKGEKGEDDSQEGEGDSEEGEGSEEGEDGEPSDDGSGSGDGDEDDSSEDGEGSGGGEGDEKEEKKNPKESEKNKSSNGKKEEESKEPKEEKEGSGKEKKQSKPSNGKNKSGEGSEESKGGESEVDPNAKQNKPASKSAESKTISKEQKEENAKQAEQEIEKAFEGEFKEEDLELKKELERALADPTFYTSDRTKDSHVQMAPSPSDGDAYNKIRKDIGNDVTTLIRNAEQAFYAKKRSHIQRHIKHGDIDFNKLVPIAKRLSKEVYQRKVEGDDLNTAVSIVIDQSGSMRGTMDEVKKVLVAIGEMLYKIGVPFEIFGTTTFDPPNANSAFTRYRGIRYMHYKNFNESWTVAHSKIMKLQPIENNIDGEAVEYAAASLQARKEKRKIVFSICDGIPESGQLNDDVFRRQLKMTCDRVRKANVEVYAIGIGTAEPQNYYGKSNFIALDVSNLFSPSTIKVFTETIMQGKFGKQG